MKIFISHKQEDEVIALEVKRALVNQGVDAYLDLLDESVMGSGEKLTNHIKAELQKCTDIIVILSDKTKESWWVPFEIGMASLKDMPIANFLVDYVELPDYLEYWPRLKNLGDIVKYVQVRIRLSNQIVNESRRMDFCMYSSIKSETQRFYEELKKVL